MTDPQQPPGLTLEELEQELGPALPPELRRAELSAVERQVAQAARQERLQRARALAPTLLAQLMALEVQLGLLGIHGAPQWVDLEAMRGAPVPGDALVGARVSPVASVVISGRWSARDPWARTVLAVGFHDRGGLATPFDSAAALQALLSAPPPARFASEHAPRARRGWTVPVPAEAGIGRLAELGRAHRAAELAHRSAESGRELWGAPLGNVGIGLALGFSALCAVLLTGLVFETWRPVIERFADELSAGCLLAGVAVRLVWAWRGPRRRAQQTEAALGAATRAFDEAAEHSWQALQRAYRETFGDDSAAH